ncbi:isoprenyl transferase [Rhizobium sp. L1K21]|nr:isoprenyl transferase [Rhizobium sp. L1K21]
MGEDAPIKTPRHVAIIMDGNGRWAAARGMPRGFGHRKGVEAVRDAVKSARAFGVEYLTLYAFSSENWRRPQEEVSDLMGLLKLFIRKDLAELHSADVRIRIIGAREGLKNDILGLLEEAEETTRNNGGLVLVIAFNYGARDEIVRGMQKIARRVAKGEIAPEAITEAILSENIDTCDIPDPELIIRTSGESRLSNFLLWQAAYSEFVFIDDLWPDFDRNLFQAALEEYSRRERRFGGVESVDIAVGSNS